MGGFCLARLALSGARVVDPENVVAEESTLLVDAGRIVECLPGGSRVGEDWQQVDLGGRTLTPGFIDLHFHGELMIAPPVQFGGALERASQRMVRHGTTAFLATTVAWKKSSLAAWVGALAEVVAEDSLSGAACLGLHLEGPWISPDMPGAMSTECIHAYDNGARTVLDAAGELLRMVTLAPENEGAALLLAELTQRGVVAALGHSRATEQQIGEGVERGISHATHLYNAMGPMHHRDPGVAGHVLGEDRMSCDLICDGAHVHPAMVRLAARAAGERLMLISDRVDLPPAAHEAEPAPGGDEGPNIRADGVIVGSRLTLDGAVRNAQAFDAMTLQEAVAACTLRPARLLGQEAERGTLRPGARADFAVLDAAGQVAETWLGGVAVNARA
jgi:N-acetylglucosamine-6-phosphate deacetylase